MYHLFASKAWRLSPLPLLLVAVGCSSPTGARVDVLAEFDTRPGNPAVTPDGRILVSMHPMDEPVLKVVEVLPDGTQQAFPNVSWSREGMAGVIGIEATRDGRVWMLDLGGGFVAPKIVVWDTRAARLDRVLQLDAGVLRPTSFLQDLVVDIDRGVAVIADSALAGDAEIARPAFLVVDLKTGLTRRVLERHASLMPNVDEMTIDGHVVRGAAEDSPPARIGLNPITLDATGTWIYFGAMTGNRLFRMPMTRLVDAEATEVELAAAIEEYGPKPVSDGVRVARGGRVFVTDLEANGVGVTRAGGYELVARNDELLSWPDGLAFGTDGAVLVTVNQLHAHPDFRGGVVRGRKLFGLVRLSGGEASSR